MKGRLTLPTNLDIIEETIALKEELGADAIRDCDGTQLPDEIKNLDAKIYRPIIRLVRIMLGHRLILKKSSRSM